MTYLIQGIDVSNLLKASKKFHEFSSHLENEQYKAGAVQAFEYTYEVAWKTMKRLLETQGKNPYTPREIFREAAASGLISDPKIWFEFIKMRNLTVHTYDEKNIERIILAFDAFSASLHDLLKNIEKLNDRS
jgi:nucleotidyltransferase substrate binding protein (TIGR01987 family)